MSPLCAHQSREFKEFTLPVKFVPPSQRVAVTTRSSPVSSLGTHQGRFLERGGKTWNLILTTEVRWSAACVRNSAAGTRRPNSCFYWPPREEHHEDPVPLFVTFFFPLSRFACVQRVTYFGAVPPPVPLSALFFFCFFFSLHRSHFPVPRSAPVPRWFACPRVLMCSAAPSVLPVPPQETVRSWRRWDTLVSSHPTKVLRLASTAVKHGRSQNKSTSGL